MLHHFLSSSCIVQHQKGRKTPYVPYNSAKLHDRCSGRCKISECKMQNLWKVLQKLCFLGVHFSRLSFDAVVQISIFFSALKNFLNEIFIFRCIFHKNDEISMSKSYINKHSSRKNQFRSSFRCSFWCLIGWNIFKISSKNLGRWASCSVVPFRTFFDPHFRCSKSDQKWCHFWPPPEHPFSTLYAVHRAFYGLFTYVLIKKWWKTDLNTTFFCCFWSYFFAVLDQFLLRCMV